MVEPNFPELDSSTPVNSFIVVGVYYWTTVEWKELLPDSSLSHLDYESRSYDIGLCGTSMSGICYIIAEQYWEAWGLFWKRSVSLCFLGVFFGFGFSVVCVVVCCLVFLCLLVTPRLLSHFFSLTGESPIKTRCIDDRLSFKRARHRQKKKNRGYITGLDLKHGLHYRFGHL